MGGVHDPESSGQPVPRRRGRWSVGLAMAALVVVVPVVLSSLRDQDPDDGSDVSDARRRDEDRDRDDRSAPASARPLGLLFRRAWPRRRWPVVVGLLALVVLAAASPVVLSLGDVQTMAVDASGARQRLAGHAAPRTPSDKPAEAPTPAAARTATGPDILPGPTPAPVARSQDDDYRSFLVIGSDERAALVGSRADVLLVGLLPHDGSDPIMFSLPRDLWLDDPCGRGRARINEAYNGCSGNANGFELTSIVVEDFTGLTVDHVAAIDFEGFEEVIDAVGGVRICVDNPVREIGKLDLPAGCTMADGDQALGWVRSRRTEEFVDGRWRSMRGVNDLTRNQRQQELILQLLGRVNSFDTASNLYGFARAVGDSVTLGSGLSVFDVASVTWGLRDRSDDIRRFSIPVTDHMTSGGAAVLLPTEPFATTFDRAIGQSLAGG